MEGKDETLFSDLSGDCYQKPQVLSKGLGKVSDFLT